MKENRESGIARRSLLQLVPTAVLSTALATASPDHCGSHESQSQPPGPYRFQFFTKEEAVLFDSVAEQIIPADEHSPGAHGAKVCEFADLILATAEHYVQDDWRAGLNLLAMELKTSSLTAWLERVSQTEGNPQTVLELFFRTMKETTINGYYTSSIGIHQDLQYQGNEYLTSFPGCHHPEHQS